MSASYLDLTDSSDLTDLTDAERWALYSPWLDAEDAALRANAVICLIHQANYLLDRQIAALEAAFVEGGGYSEQLATARMAERRKKDLSDRTALSDQTDLKKIPLCKLCGSYMALRTAKGGKNPGSQFWGCTGYPGCKGTSPL